MRAEIYWIDNISPGRLAVLPRPRGGDWLEDELQSLRDQGVDLLVSLLTEDETNELELSHEAELAANLGIGFLPFPIHDRTVPDASDGTATFFDTLHHQFLSGDGIAVHCRMGIGRSSLVVATVLSLAGHAPDDAFEQISAARGVAVPDTDDQRKWVAQFVRSQRLRGRDTAT